MRKQIQLRDKISGEEAPIFVIAEIGVTCNYDLEMAKALIGLSFGTFAATNVVK